MAVYVKVADAVDLPPGQAIAVTVGDKRLALSASMEPSSPSTTPAHTGADLFQRES
jgi:hypothetical protein